MPGTVQCPHCGIDGTEAANEFIRLTAQAQAGGTAQGNVPVVGNRSAAAHRPAASSSALVKEGKRTRAFGEPNMMLGTVGALGAAILGMLVWFLLIKWTNTEFGIVAWGVGGLTGIGCRVLGAGYSQKLGIIAGVCAFLAIVGGEYLATHAAYSRFVDEFLGTAYEYQMAYAKRAVQVKTETEARAFLAAEQDEGAGESGEVTAQDVSEFMNDDLPQLKEFVAGRPNRAEFEAKVRASLRSMESQASVLKESVSLWTLLWLFVGVGTAYRLGTGETGS
jgi:hypothetical protein